MTSVAVKAEIATGQSVQRGIGLGERWLPGQMQLATVVVEL